MKTVYVGNLFVIHTVMLY